MTTKTKGKAADVALAQQLIAGTAKHFANTPQVVFASGSFTPAQITAKLQSLVTLRADVNAAKAATKAKVAAETADMPALHAFLNAFVSFVKATYGSAPDVLADFGIHPKTRAPLTVEAKAAAAAKRKATREARKTMGSKQKKDIKGTVIGVTVTPVSATQPTAAASPGQGAPAATSSAGATTQAPPTPHAT